MLVETLTNEIARVLFPGALNSKFTNVLEFTRPSATEAIPTYRVMDQYGVVIDEESGVNTTDEEALKLYSNMVTCELSCLFKSRV